MQKACLCSSGDKEVLRMNSHTKSMAGKEIVYTFSIHKIDILYKVFYSAVYISNIYFKQFLDISLLLKAQHL